MYISRSLLASALVLSFSSFAQARVAQKKLDTDNLAEPKAEKTDNEGVNRLPVQNILRKRQGPLSCPPDFYTNILNEAAASDVQIFCNRWLGLPAATVSSKYTPSTTIVAAGRTNETRFITEVVTVFDSAALSVGGPTSRPTILPRAANFAARVQAVNQIIDSVLDTASTTGPPAPINTNRAEDENGLTHACECMVQWGKADPTATVTTVSTAPVRYTMVGENSGAILTVTSTITSTVNGSNSIGSTSISATITAPPSMSLISSGSIAPTTTFTGGSIVGPRVPTVIGIPFTCPSANATNPRFIVGNVQYEYIVYCSKAIKPSDSVSQLDTIPNVENETACAEYCSLLNHAVNGIACGAAQFTRNSNGDGGSCTLDRPLSGNPTDNIVDQPGSVAIILKGSSTANGQDCLVPGESPGVVTAAPSDILSSISSVGYSLSVPGLVTRSETGGASQTYYSTGSTDSRGFYYYTWYSIYKSSSQWWEVYAATWSSCSQVPITITQQLPASVSSGIVVTTIINGAITTVIAGNLTSIYSNGGAIIPPTGVPASATSGGVVLSTGFSTALSTSEGGSGGQGQAPGSTAQIGANGTALTLSGATATTVSEGGNGVITPSATSLPVVNSTIVVSGSEGLTISVATSISNSTAAGGGSGPSTTSGAVEVTASGQTSVGTSIGGSGVASPVSTNGTLVPTISATGGSGPSTTSGAVEVTASGQTSVGTSIGGSGVASPVSTNGTLVLNTSATGGSSPGTTSGAVEVTASGQTSVGTSIGGSGVAPPVSTNGTLVPTSAGDDFSNTDDLRTRGSRTRTSSAPSGTAPPAVIVAPNSTVFVVTSGSSQFTESGTAFVSSEATFVSLSTGGAGSQGPIIATLNSTALPTAPSGSAIATSSGLTSTRRSSSGGGYDYTPLAFPYSEASSTIVSTIASVEIPIVSINSSLSTSTGVVSTGGLTSILLSTGSGGIIPPAPTNISETVSTLTINSTSAVSTTVVVVVSSSVVTFPASASVFPSASSNITLPLGTESVVLSTGSSTGIILSTGSGGVISPSETVTVPASLTPSPSSNLTISSSTGDDFSNTDNPRIPGRRSSSTRVSSGTAPPASGTPIFSSNVTLPGTTVVSTSTESLIVPSNSTSALYGSGTAPPVVLSSEASVTPSSSSNATIPSSTGGVFSNTDNPRVPGNRTSTLYTAGTAPPVVLSSEASVTPSSSSNATIPSSTPYTAGTAPPVVLSSEASVTPSSSSNATIPSSTGIFSNTDNPRVPGRRNRTSSSPYAPGTAPPVVLSSEASVTPSSSSNATIPSSTGGVFSNTDNPRVPGNRTSTPYAPGTAPPIFASSEASITPSLSSNVTIIPTTGVFSNTDNPRVSGNLTLTSYGTVPLVPASITPSPSSNATIPTPTGDFSNTEGLRTAGRRNSTSPVGTGTAPAYGTAPVVSSTPASITPSPSSNSTISSTPTGDFSNTDDLRTAGRRNSTSPVGTGTAPAYGTAPVVSSTPASITPSLSVNATIPTPTGDFSNTDDLRTAGRRNSTSPVGTGTAPPVIGSTGFPVFNTTAPINTGTAPPVLNVTSLPGTGVVITSSSSRSRPYGGYGPPPGETSPSTTTATTVSDDFNQSEGDRFGRSRSRSGTAGGSSAGPIASANTTLVGTGTASSFVPTLSLNSSAPVGTASVPLTTVVSASPTTVANITVPLSTGVTVPPSVIVVTGTSGLPVVSSNSSAFLPTGTASSFTLAPPANFTDSFETYNSEVTGTSGFPTPSSNVTVPGTLVTSPPASVTPIISSNVTVPGSLVTSPPISVTPVVSSNGTSGFPTLSSNITVPGSLVTSPPASVTPIISSNVTVPGTLVTSPPASVTPIISSNVTVPGSLVTSPPVSVTPVVSSNGTSGFPTLSSNVTVPGTLVTSPPISVTPIISSNVTVPGSLVTSPPVSVTPVVSSNGTTEACPTVPETTVIPHTQIITTISYETVVLSPSTCLPTASDFVPFPTANVTFSEGTSPGSIGLPVETAPTTETIPSVTASASGTVVIVVSATPSPTLTTPSIPNLALPGTSNYRRSGEIATQEQIDNACKLDSNLILNSNFAIGNVDDGALGWAISPSPSDDPTVRFSRNTTENGTVASVQTARTAHSMTVSQPLTLCPNTRYRFTSTNRAANVLSKCTTEYLIGNQPIYTATPGEVASSRDGYFTSGSTPSDVSQDLRARSRCEGESGANVGADAAGWMGVEFGGLEVVPAPA